MPVTGRFTNKVAIVTGGGQGIGYAIAEKLALEGATTIIADLNPDKGALAAQKIVERGYKAKFVRADISLEGQLAELMQSSLDNHHSLDILVNSAAPKRGAIQSDQDKLSDWDLNMSVLLKGAYLSAVHASRAMRGGAGAIVNISSIVAFAITHQPAGYHVAKAGLEHMTRYLAVELAERNIRVNSVCPALVDMDDRQPLTADATNKAVVESIVPLKRAATPGDIASAVAFLCSDEASYVTGQCLVVDGGLSALEPFHAARTAYRAATLAGSTVSGVECGK